ncbi:MAG: hypothetical protein WDM79_18915 [Terricaulis sp.]
MADDTRIQLTVRLKREDHSIFVQAAEECGLEGGTAARQLVEMMIKRLRHDNNLLAALVRVQGALLEDKQAA